MRLAHFFREAKRRKVYTVAAAYVGLSLVMHQLGGALFDAFGFPVVAVRVLTILLLLFFPIVLVLAWIFDIGPEGVQRTAPLSKRPEYKSPSITSGWQVIEHATPPASLEPIPELVSEVPAPERVQRATIALIRHELRTPINAIIGYSEMLLEDVQDAGAAEMAAGLTIILASGRELAGLVDAILGAERVEAEQRDLQSYAAEVRSDLLEPLRSVMQTTEVLVQRCQHGALPHLMPDLNRILAAARKLLDLSSDIGAITAPHEARPTHLAQATSIAEDVLSRIRSVAAAAPGADRQGNLLIVDDSPINRDLLARQLAHKGYMITTAENGRVALERLSEQTFDLVLLDVLMPELDGVETLRRIKSDVALRDTPVIMISALDEIDSVIRCLEIGAADFLSKPFHPTLLDARISATLKAHARRTGSIEPERGGGAEIVSAGFPRHLARRVRDGDRRIIESVADAAVLVLDMEHAVAKVPNPAQRAAALDVLTRAAQQMAEQHAIDSVVVRGGHVVIMAGFPLADEAAAENLARLAQAFALQSEQLGFPCRAALHRGALHGAVVGAEAPSYWLWGDGYELARKLAGAAERGRTLVSPIMQRSLQHRFRMSNAGVIELAGHGQVRCHVLEQTAAALEA
jgi:DNA-binding response OmpR family regulator